MSSITKIILSGIAVAVIFYGLGVISAFRFGTSADIQGSISTPSESTTNGIIQSPPPTITQPPTISPAILDEPCYQLQKGLDDTTYISAKSFNIDEKTLLDTIEQSAEIVSSNKESYNWQKLINNTKYQNEDQFMAEQVLMLAKSLIMDKFKVKMEDYAKSLVSGAPTGKYQDCASKLNANPTRSSSASSNKEYGISYNVGSGGANIKIKSANVVTSLGMGNNVLSNLVAGKSINSGVNFNITGSIQTGSNSGLTFGYTSNPTQIPLSATWRMSF